MWGHSKTDICQPGRQLLPGAASASTLILDLPASRTGGTSVNACRSVQFSCSVMSDSLWPHGPQHARSLSITNSWSPPEPMSILSVTSSNHHILCHPLLLPPSIFPSIRVFSNESALRIRWPKYWSFSFSISPSNEHPGVISFRIDWLDLLAIQGTLRSLLQCHKPMVFCYSSPRRLRQLLLIKNGCMNTPHKRSSLAGFLLLALPYDFALWITWKCKMRGPAVVLRLLAVSLSWDSGLPGHICPRMWFLYLTYDLQK